MFEFVAVGKENNKWEAECFLAKNMPCFQGHFPNLPIFPAIAQLEMLQNLVSHMLQESWQVVAAPTLKFVAPIIGDTQVTIKAEYETSYVTFRIFVGDVLCSRGKLEVAKVL